MNIFSHLPGISQRKSEAEAAELDAEQAKRDRIAYHRDHVRNGPVRHNIPTNGQLRRAEERRRARKAKIARRRQVRAYFKSEREAAVLRGHLQAAGVLPYSGHFKPNALQITASANWIMQRFGTQVEEVTELEVRNALTAALNRWQALTGRELSALDGSAL